MEREYLNINGTATAENYPYGRLRTQAFFSVEFNPARGFRSVFQTINPKNGRVNAPKKTTYYRSLIYQYINKDIGHVVSEYLFFSPMAQFAVTAQQLAEVLPAVQATLEMNQYLANIAYNSLLIEYSRAMSRTERKDELKARFKELLAILKDMTLTGVLRWHEIDPATYMAPEQVAQLLNTTIAA